DGAPFEVREDRFAHARSARRRRDPHAFDLRGRVVDPLQAAASCDVVAAPRQHEGAERRIHVGRAAVEQPGRIEPAHEPRAERGEMRGHRELCRLRPGVDVGEPQLDHRGDGSWPWQHRTVQIRRATSDDWPAIWSFMEGIVRAGETYAWDPGMGEDA